MSSQVGYSTTPSYGFLARGANTDNLAASLFTMPSPGGLVTDIHAYAATYSGSATGYVCLWNGSGTLLGSVAVTVSTTNAWVGGTLATPVFVAGGSDVFIGWQTPAANGFSAQYDSNAAYSWEYVENTTVPGNIVSGHTTQTSQVLGAYANYTPTEAYVNTGTETSPVWTAGPVYVNTGTETSPVWTAVSGLQVWNGSSWVNAS